MNILVTVDSKYLSHLRVMLGSLFFNNPEESFQIYMIGEKISQEDMEKLAVYCTDHGSVLHPMQIQTTVFDHAPVIRYYSQAMYYRLLAAEFLPDSLDRILYLDPDILVIGKVRPLYEMEFSDELFAAAMHNGLTGISGYVSKLRLPNYETDQYFNSGVLLMNLPKMRQEVHLDDIFNFVEKYRSFLVLPDQDILNGLYGDRIFSLDETIWNYDVRQYEKYRFLSQRGKNMDWVMGNTVILHFCGKNKPWNPTYRGRFSSLYKHYTHLIAENRI